MGAQVQDKPHPLTQCRMDGWTGITGLGTAQDKGHTLRHVPAPRISRPLAESLWSTSGVGGAIIEEILNDAFAPGWEITLPATEDTPQGKRDAAERAAEINAKLSAWHDRTKFLTELKRHKSQARAYGGGILRLGVDDGLEATEPLADVKSFDWVRAFDRFDATGSGAPVLDAASVHFAFPAHYLIGTILAGQATSQGQLARSLGFSERAIQERSALSPTARSAAQSQIVHADRVWRTDGPYLSDRTRIENDGWGQSVFQRVIDSIKGWDSAQANVRHIVQDYVQIAYSIKGFQQLMLMNSEEDIRKRFALMDRIRSNVNAIIYDADGEKVEKIISSASGLPEIIDRIMLDVSAASRIPITRLFGVSPGGFGTGESEGLNWRQQVEAYRQDDLRPTLRHTYGLLFQTPEFSMVPEDWSIAFGPIDSPTEEQQATNRKLTAETDSIYITTGVLDATEVTASRFGGAEYSSETNVALEDRETPSGESDEAIQAEAERLNAESGQDPLATEGAEAVAQGDAKVQDTALNGAQVTALLELVKEVGLGNIPAESAIQIALVAYPTIDPTEANRMFKPAEALAASKPDPTPATLPSSAAPFPTPEDPPRSLPGDRGSRGAPTVDER